MSHVTRLSLSDVVYVTSLNRHGWELKRDSNNHKEVKEFTSCTWKDFRGAVCAPGRGSSGGAVCAPGRGELMV